MGNEKIKLTSKDKQQLQDIFRLYFDNYIFDEIKIDKLVKLAEKFNLDSDFIDTLVDECTNYLPF